MAWNEPGGNNQDPWGGRKKNDGPPDLDEALKKFQDKINGLFGGKSGNSSGGGGSASLSPAVLGVGLLIALLAYLLFGIYQLDEKEQAVVLRLGKFHSIVGPGLHWNPKFIDRVYIVNTTEERSHLARGFMITEDISIVELPVTVQYNISNIQSFVLNVRDPENSLKQATESALRHVVGSTKLDPVLSEGRQQIAFEVEERLQDYLNAYGAGIQIVNVNVQQGAPPIEVKAAFDDVVKAKEDRERLINESERYANAVVPEAEGRAARIREEANGYREKVIAQAEGEAERFTQLLAEYSKAPEVTRERLYIDAIESVMSNSSKVMVDVEGGNNMLFLPLDKIVNQTGVASGSSGDNLSQDVVREIQQRVSDELRRNQINNGRRGVR
ncbi:MAG: FtsH protease activity modulator HflK [Pseudomonadota bacterium]